MINMVQKVSGNRMFTELMMWQKYYRARFNLTQRRFLRALRTRDDLRINLACGPNQREGWVNVDITWDADVTWDLRRKLPFVDNSAEIIFCEHYLEHVDYVCGASEFVAECCRVLRPGGILRLVVPDIRKLVDAYVRNDRAWFEYIEPNKRHDTVGHGLMQCIFYDGDHRSGWDFETLKMVLEKHGLVEVMETEYSSLDGDVNCIESPSESRAAHSLCVNARKP